MLTFIDFSDLHVLAQVKMIGYPLMFLIMILEGPLMTILAAFAASLGIFNVYVVLFLSMTGDIVGDVILYALGYHGGAQMLKKAEKILKVKAEIVQHLERLFLKHGKKTIFAVKSTTGLCWITFIAAGTVRMKFRDFLYASFLGGIVWSGFLVASGYFFGYAFRQISQSIKYAGILIFVAVVAFYAIITIYKKYKAQVILAEKENGNTNQEDAQNHE